MNKQDRRATYSFNWRNFTYSGEPQNLSTLGVICPKIVICIIKGKWNHRTVHWKESKRCWSFGLAWEYGIYYRASYKSDHTGMERLIGDTADISEWNYFGYDDLCQYWDKNISAKNTNIGRWMGILHRVGSALFCWIITDKGKVIARTTL